MRRRGLLKVSWQFILVMAAYNLVRITWHPSAAGTSTDPI
jgi:hypothetical protein